VVGRGGASPTGCGPPHRPQKVSVGLTWFPHWLQNGHPFIRYAIRSPDVSAALDPVPHPRSSGPADSIIAPEALLLGGRQFRRLDRLFRYTAVASPPACGSFEIQFRS